MRLIDADVICEKCHVPKGAYNCKLCKVGKAPTIDAVEVVRCQECKHGKTWKNAFGITGFKCESLCVDLSPEAFCSYGVRIDEE